MWGGRGGYAAGPDYAYRGGCAEWISFNAQQKRDKVRNWWGSAGNLTTAVLGVDIAHPGWESSYGVQADAYCAGAGLYQLGVLNLYPQATITTTPTDAQIANFLGRAGYNCSTFEALSLNQKRTAVRASGAAHLNYALFGGSNQNVFGQIDAFIQAVDAYCLKLAVQATNMPHPSKTFAAKLRPAGQATTTTVSPLIAGLIGAAVGGLVTFMVLR